MTEFVYWSVHLTYRLPVGTNGEPTGNPELVARRYIKDERATKTVKKQPPKQVSLESEEAEVEYI